MGEEVGGVVVDGQGTGQVGIAPADREALRRSVCTPSSFGVRWLDAALDGFLSSEIQSGVEPPHSKKENEVRP